MFITKRDDCALLMMAALCVASVAGVQAAPELAIGIGAVMLFLGHSRACLTLGRVPHLLRRPGILLLAATPVVLNVLALLLACTVLPEYLPYLRARAGAVQTGASLLRALGQMALLTTVEEVAWRGYFQQVLGTRLRGPAFPSIVVTAGIVAVGQFSAGPPAAMVYHLLLVFFSGVLYGTLFHRTGNAVISAAAHLVANVLSALLLVFVQGI